MGKVGLGNRVTYSISAPGGLFTADLRRSLGPPFWQFLCTCSGLAASPDKAQAGLMTRHGA